MKFIKLSGRPRKKINVDPYAMTTAKAIGCVKVGGYLLVNNAEMALKIVKKPWVVKKLLEMKNGTA